MKLWLVRHARLRVGAGICHGQSDIAADAPHTGRVAGELAARLPRGIALHTSPLRRCLALSQAVAALRPDLVVRSDARLAEMDFGRWEGRPWDAIGAEALDAWVRDFADHAPGGGESVRRFMTRVAAALSEARGSGRDAAWITHAGVIRATGLLAQGVSCVERADQWPREGPGFGRWQRLELP